MHLSQLLGPFALLATLLLALGSLFGMLRRRQAQRRLAALSAVADAFAAGNSLTRADASGHDAIGRLAQRFNHMIAQLEGERRALRDSEQELRSLIEAAPVGMLVLDQQGNIDSANPAAA